MPKLSEIKLAVIGLGYVGLPLAAEFGKRRSVVGFDINHKRIEALQAGHDSTLEVSDDELREATGLTYSANPQDLAACNIFIVTVPTPIDEHKRPDLTPLVKASETIGKVLKKGDIVIYESTVYPGATEEDCVPVLERYSGLKFNVDFYAGYSPERINPGDKEHRVSTIKKVTSGSTAEVADLVDALYREIIVAGTHKAPSIRVAEAAKVIENTQRDLNIALMNELSVLFARLDIDTLAVLEAAGTKWNFLPFRPGLVGGHCIGVDPYYLTDKAEKVGYIPQVILAGRRINDNMGRYVARTTIKKMVQNKIDLSNASVGVLGLTFKENCPDIRNSKVIDIIREFQDFGIRVVATDPYADRQELAHEYPGVDIGTIDANAPVDALIVAVAHNEYATMDARAIKQLLRGAAPVVADVKSLFDLDQLKQAGITAWRL
ncbi:Vi polysaccharide biosynthesis protein VipA/TviB [Thauera propionica]|uniref:Vi polysaccharide biosynthesis protein VipA/TviB n=1 Tax=Thauera propionica TaxID=2019431 RepID=A0A235F367_9RHOO|nr:nucleotide sugar dehydrogenase [Thauera propionica]OYD55704.1 Vi polysaccharide biosynthesis protein VipA/TviB [Thauera propionica]